MLESSPKQARALHGIVTQFGCRTVMRDRAMIQHDDAIGDFERCTHVLLDQQHADAFFFQALHRAHHVLHYLRRQPLTRLVHQHQSRAAKQCARNRNHLHLATGKILAVTLEQILERAENFAAFADRPAPKLRTLLGDRQIPSHRQARHHAPLFRYPGNATSAQFCACFDA